jgi:hypothetical protein
MKSNKSPQDASKKEEMTASQDGKRGPVKTFRVEDVHASIFARAYQGRTYHSVSLTRGYRDAAGTMSFTKNFDPECLGRLVAVIQQAAEYLHGLEKAEPEAQ